MAQGIKELQDVSLHNIGKNLDTTPVPCYQFYLTERSFGPMLCSHAEHRASLGHYVITLCCRSLYLFFPLTDSFS
jgi:hypothetical protein